MTSAGCMTHAVGAIGTPRSPTLRCQWGFRGERDCWGEHGDAGDAGGRLADAGGRLADAGGRLADAGERLADAGGRLAEAVGAGGGVGREELGDGEGAGGEGVLDRGPDPVLGAGGRAEKCQDRAAEAAADHAGAVGACAQGGFDRYVRLGPGDLEVIAERLVGLGEQLAYLGVLAIAEQVDGAQHAGIVGTDMPGTSPQDRVTEGRCDTTARYAPEGWHGELTGSFLALPAAGAVLPLGQPVTGAGVDDEQLSGERDLS